MYEEIIQACSVYFAWAEAIRARGDKWKIQQKKQYKIY
jgi:hypothetical protein